MSQLSHAQFPLRRHPNLLVDHRRSRSAAVAEPRGANGEAVTGSGGRLHFGMVAGIKSERWPTSNRNPWPDCLGIRRLFEEGGADRDLEARSAHSSRPRGDVRSEADCPLSAPVSGLRREDRVDVRARMTVREIQGHLLELYGLEVSPDLISTVTDAVLETVAEGQNRPLEPMYPLVFFDALRVKIRDEGLVRNKAVYVALGV